MLRISKISDYAVVVLADLASGKASCKSAATIAKDTSLPEPTVSKILKLLSSADIVDSKRGKDGGYTLISSPEALSIGKIVTAIDGPISITACSDNDTSDCRLIDLCCLRGRWDGVNTAIRSALDVISLADMLKPEGTSGLVKVIHEPKERQSYGSH